MRTGLLLNTSRKFSTCFVFFRRLLFKGPYDGEDEELLCNVGKFLCFVTVPYSLPETALFFALLVTPA